MIDYPALIKEAFTAREAAYAPYSSFFVGAALLTKDGNIYRGCNIESASFSPTNCAERTAFFSAVSQGEREFAAIAVVGGGLAQTKFSYVYPCGVCRQVMAEFCTGTFEIVVAKSQEEYEIVPLDQLLPHSFGRGDMKE